MIIHRSIPRTSWLSYWVLVTTGVASPCGVVRTLHRPYVCPSPRYSRHGSPADRLTTPSKLSSMHAKASPDDTYSQAVFRAEGVGEAKRSKLFNERTPCSIFYLILPSHKQARSGGSCSCHWARVLIGLLHLPDSCSIPSTNESSIHPMADQEDTAILDFHRLLYAEWYNSLSLVLYSMQGLGGVWCRDNHSPTLT